MALVCLTGSRMTMRATILHREAVGAPDIDLDAYGEWVNSQDPLSGEVVRIWEMNLRGPDNKYGTNDDIDIRTTPCVARGIVDGGIRVAGTTERFGASYENIDFVKMWIPPNIRISKRDRVTNIRDPRGNIMWREEEFSDPSDVLDIPRATVFNVMGVTPLFNAFNRSTEQYVMLARAEVSG